MEKKFKEKYFTGKMDARTCMLYAFLLFGTLMMLLLYVPDVMTSIISGIETYLIHRKSVDAEHLKFFIRYTYATTWLLIASFLLARNVVGKLYCFYPIYAVSSFALSHIEIWNSDSFKGIQSICDFSDCLPLISSGADTFYPPLQNVVIKMMHTLLFKGVGSESTLMYYTTLLMFLFSMFLLCVCGFYYFCVYEHDKLQISYAGGVIIVFSFLISSPVIYTYERLNFLILALGFTMFFLVVDYCAYPKYEGVGIFSLIIAANMKYYPAVYGLVLLKKKRWKEAVQAAVGGILVFVAAQLAILDRSSTNSSLGEALGNLSAFTSSALDDSLGGAGISIKELVYKIFVAWNMLAPSKAFNITYMVVTIVFIIICVIIFFLSDRTDHELLMLASMCIFVPPMSYNYSMVFLLMPFAVLLKNIICGAHDGWDVVEMVIYSILAACVYEYYPFFLRGKIYVTVLILWGLVVVRTLYKRGCQQWKRNSKKNI